ncbi:MAG: diaminopimelate epimerase, partial [Alcaligenaceae bacterium]|nr:diaminopimelate epimerase [Alcaligenaceae bacterium]
MDPSSRHTPLPFTKMHGLGNDFVIIDATLQPFTLTSGNIKAMADRHFGVGFDQLLVVEPAPLPGLDFGYRIFNADGSEVEQCGNGARCFARYVRDNGLTNKDLLRVQTCAGIIELHITATGQVRVNMGIPKFQPAQIPFAARQAALRYAIAAGDQTLSLSVVNMG